MANIDSKREGLSEESRNTVSTPIPLDGVRAHASQALNREANDVEAWQRGAKNYAAFLDTIPPEQRRAFTGDDFMLLFLGEKPAIFGDVTPSERACESQLSQAGVVLRQVNEENGYLYRPEAVRNVVQTYSGEFAGLPTDPRELIDAIGQKKGKDIPRGLLLGYPLASCKEHDRVVRFKDAMEVIMERLTEKSEKRKLESALYMFRHFGKGGDPSSRREILGRDEAREIFRQNISRYSTELNMNPNDPELLQTIEYLMNQLLAHASSGDEKSPPGKYWIDYSSSEESRAKMERIRWAFELSHIKELASIACQVNQPAAAESNGTATGI